MLKTFGSIFVATGLILLIALLAASRMPLTYSTQGFYGQRMLKLFTYDSKYVAISSVRKFSKISIEGLQYYLSIKVFPRTNVLYINRTLYKIKVDLENVTIYLLGKNEYNLVYGLILSSGNTSKDLEVVLDTLNSKAYLVVPMVRQGNYFVANVTFSRETYILMVTTIPRSGIKVYTGLGKIVKLPHFKIIGLYSFTFSTTIYHNIVIKPTIGQLTRSLDLIGIGCIMLALDYYRNPEDYTTLKRYLGKFKPKKNKNNK